MKLQHCDNYLPYRWGKHSPYDFFIGNPYEINGYGCNAPVIEKAIKDYFDENEHCMTLIGYNNETVTVSDPREGIVCYDRKTFEQR